MNWVYFFQRKDLMMIEIKKYLKTVTNSKLPDSEKVNLLSDLVENIIRYSEGQEKINKQFQERTRAIFENRG